MSGFLQSLDFRVSKAAYAEETLAALAQTAPNIALLDVRLPGMSGIEAVCEILCPWGGDAQIVAATKATSGDLTDVVRDARFRADRCYRRYVVDAQSKGTS